MTNQYAAVKDAAVKFVAAIVVACWVAGGASADEPAKFKGQAPANHDVLKHTRGGAYFVARELKVQYDQLLARVSLLKSQIDSEQISGADAVRELGELQTKLEDLRKQIEEKKFLVAAKVRMQSEVSKFDFGPEQLLVVTADNIRVEDWNGPGIKCVLTKTVLSGDDKPVDDHFQGIKLVHRHGLAPDLVGKTAEERQAEEQAFLDSPDGKALNDKQRAARKRLVNEIAGAYTIYQNFQGKQIDTVEIEGLTYEQGNRQISVEASSQGGGASHGSDWQRHASLTVYVPTAKGIALRGCMVRLDVKGVTAPLTITSSGSQNIDYDGLFQIHDLHGDLAIDNAPIDLVEDTHGNVAITSTVEVANMGTTHENDERRLYTPPPREVVCRGIHGDFVAWFSRADLRLEGIDGAIDVRNEFGNTRLIAPERFAAKANRIISESGRIDVRLQLASLGDLPLFALTNCGLVRTNFRQEVLEDRSFTVSDDGELGRRNWHGVRSKRTGDDPGAFFTDFQRPAQVLRGEQRSPGVDLITRSGTLVLMSE